jgi:hypothetical protein
MGSVYLKCVCYSRTKETASLGATDSPLLVATICLWCEFDDGVQRHLYVGQVGLRQVMEVGVAATKAAGSHGGKFTARKPKQYVQTSEDGLLQSDEKSQDRRPVRSTLPGVPRRGHSPVVRAP